MDYCAHCGARTDPSSPRCAACGVSKEITRAAMHQRWLWIFLGAASALLVLFHFAPVLRDQFLPLQVAPEDPFDTHNHIRLFVEGGAFKLITPVLVVAVVGAVVAGLARRPIYRELALGSVLLTVVQWVIWIIRVKGSASLLFSSGIMFISEGGRMLLPAFMGLILVNLLAGCSALGCAAATSALVERLSGETRCRSCDHLFKIVPARPAACPQCGHPTSNHKRTTLWGRVVASAVATTIVFLLLVSFGGPALKFYWSCDFDHPSEMCQAGIDRVNESKPGDYYFWQKQQGDETPGVILDAFKYVMFTCPLFLLGPLALALTNRRGRGTTAAWAALLAWPAVMLGALVFLGFAQFDTVIVLALRLHLLAGVPWVLAGLAGAWLGKKFGPQVDMAEELGIELPPTS